MDINQLEIVSDGLARHVVQFNGVLGIPIQIYIIDLIDRVIYTSDEKKCLPPSLKPFADKMLEGYLLLGFEMR
jgi:hypothetical protein